MTRHGYTFQNSIVCLMVVFHIPTCVVINR